MKNLSALVILVFVASVSWSFQSGAQAQIPPPAATPAKPGVKKIQVAQERVVEDTATDYAYRIYVEVLKKSNVTASTLDNLKVIQQKVEAAKTATSLEGLRLVFSEVKDSLSMCKSYVANSVGCCENPDSCVEQSIAGTATAVANAAIDGLNPLLGQVMGAAGNCLGVIPGATSSLGLTKGNARACKMLKDGGELKQHGGQKFSGCVDICEDVKALAHHVNEAAIAIHDALPEEERDLIGTQRVVREAEEIYSLATENAQACSNRLQAREQAVNNQIQSYAQSITSAFQCAVGFLGDDADSGSNGLEGLIADCSDSAYRAQNPGNCDLAANNSASLAANQKTSGGRDFLGATTNDSSDLDEPLPTDLAPIGTPAAAKATNANAAFGAGPGGAPGGLGGAPGNNTNGVSQKTRGPGQRPPSANLISGYGKAKVSGSNTSGRFPATSKGWSRKFRDLKVKKIKKNAKALAALNKLLKSGVNPNMSDSIFAKSTTRFNESCQKNNFFDFKRNAKTWIKN